MDVVDGDGVNDAVRFGKRDEDQRWCSAGGAKRKVEGGMEGVVVGSMEGSPWYVGFTDETRLKKGSGNKTIKLRTCIHLFV